MKPIPVLVVLLLVAMILNITLGVTPVRAAPDMIVNAVTIDGKWTTLDEWSDASQVNSSPLHARAKNDDDFFYVLLELTSVSTEQVGDGALLYFDTAHDKSSMLQPDDLAIGLTWLADGSTSVYAEGVIGGAWTSISVPAGVEVGSSLDPTNDPYSAGPAVKYEFKIPISLFQSGTIGVIFQIYYDGGKPYFTIDSSDPSSWSDWQLTSVRVPSGFRVRPIAFVTEQLNDLEVGKGAFGDYVYYLVSDGSNDLYRVRSDGSENEVFVSSLAVEAVLTYGFGGDLFIAGHSGDCDQQSPIIRVKPDRSVTHFGKTPVSCPGDIEGITFDGNYLYVSFWQEGSTIYRLDGEGNWALWTSRSWPPDQGGLGSGGSIRGMAFGPGGDWGTDLYVLNEYTSGEINKVDDKGRWGVFADNWSPNWAEYFALSDPKSSFGSYMYVTVMGSALWRITASGEASIFATGFKGFSTNGVTGIRFSNDGETLFVTDDNAGIVYAIENLNQSSQAVGGYIASSNGLALLTPYVALIGLIGVVGLVGLRKRLRS